MGAARRSHWRALLQARAIENQCFMAAADACGMLNEKGLAGSSMIVSPWGDILAEASPDEEELLTWTINFDQLEEVRIASRLNRIISANYMPAGTPIDFYACGNTS
jgi:predicted amidohydrolase